MRWFCPCLSPPGFQPRSRRKFRPRFWSAWPCWSVSEPHILRRCCHSLRPPPLPGCRSGSWPRASPGCGRRVAACQWCCPAAAWCRKSRSPARWPRPLFPPSAAMRRAIHSEAAPPGSPHCPPGVYPPRSSVIRTSEFLTAAPASSFLARRSSWLTGQLSA